jgi:CRP/FNR family transcriptional regulator, cyclic AMP receptor protein
MKTLEPLLAEHPFFKGLEPRFLELLVGCASNVRFEAEQYIFRQGEAANRFYLLRAGCVALELYAPGRGAVTVETLDEGDVLGWSWLIPPYQRQFNARALETTRAFAFDAECLRRKCEEDHALGYEMMKRFSTMIVDRLTGAYLQLMDVYGVPAS